jgi:Chitobiase/beta-hexosaminidase C-terminal domain/Right handed beta helix region
MHFEKRLLAIGLIVLSGGIAQVQERRTTTGDGSGSGNGARSVSVSPTSASLATGASQDFTAEVRHGQSEGVTWSLDGPGALTNITTTSVTYTASGSSATTATLTATSNANTNRSASAVVTITVPSPQARVATPTFSPAGGTFSSAQPVTINDATSGASIYYCIAPCTPSTSSTPYRGSFSVSASETINAIATKSGDTTSAVGAAAYVINSTPPPPVSVATPTFSPAGGTFSSAQPVTINDATSGASIYYCIAPCSPSTSSTPYRGSFSVSASETINAIATKSGDTTSAVGSAAYVINSTPPPTGTTFYVSPSGDDSNAGSSTAPWLTIQHAANSVSAGDTVYVLAGTYHESVTIAVSGSSTTGPVSFISSPIGAAIVDGTGLTPSTSNTQGLFNIEDESYVTIQGFGIQNFTTSNANAAPAGIWVTGSGSNIQILNNTVTKITTTSEKNGNAFGIAVYGSEAPAAISYITISGNTVYNCKTGNSETVNVDGNVTNFTITSNLIHDNDNIGIDAIGFEGVSPDSAYDYARNGLIGQNTVYNISAIHNAGEGNQYDADGIYCDGCADVVIEGNNVSTSDLGIEVASEHSGHVSTGVTVRNNLVYNNNSVGISIGGYASNVGGTSNCYIVNNSLLENDSQQTGSGEFQVQYHATGNYFENNIVYANSQALFINNFTNSESVPVTSNYNIFYTAGGGANFLWDGRSISSFASYQSSSHQDGNSPFANPDYVSLTLASPNLQVSSGSPALNAGNNLGSTIVGTVDYSGNLRVNASNQIDIGAYEKQ